MGVRTLLDDNRRAAAQDCLDTTNCIDAALGTVDVLEPHGDAFDQSGGTAEPPRELRPDPPLETFAEQLRRADCQGDLHDQR
jgi:hypothetical protein